MRNIINYIEEAKKNEKVFRLILDKFGIENKNLGIEEIYVKYSQGNRMGIWTILGFGERKPNVYVFAWEDVAPLSGHGSVDLYTFDNDAIKTIENVEHWWA